jgi:tetratricopeptide (TPR) repeat protein
MSKELNQLQTKMIEEKEFDLSAEANPKKYFGLIEDYIKLGKIFNAVLVFEDLVYYHPSYMDKVSAAIISKMIGEIDDYLIQSPDNARGYYFKAFLQFVRGRYNESMATFFIAQGLNLDAKYMKRKIKYMQFCRKKMKENEERNAKYKAALIVKDKVKDANFMKRLDDNVSSVKDSNLSKDEIEYRCALNRN